RYKNATLGFLWMLLNPVLQMIILSIVFSIYVKINISNDYPGQPYPVFLLCAILPWNFLSVSLNAGSHSLVEESNLVKKVFFPREIIPISIVVGHLINFLTALLLFLPFPLIFQKQLPWELILLLIPIILLTFFVISLTALVSNLDVFFRDTRYIVEALVMVWFYATPIFYPVSYVPEKLRLFYHCNPMVSFVQMFRDILLKGDVPGWIHIIYTSIIIIFVAGLARILYRKRGPVMADYL
ncbi:ABC transporter permease, partial [bacterium]|nr:ABC transporter permease [candidate division CSSED10-310 bacterium]